MAMELKDYHMTAEELTKLTKYLTTAIAEQIDWDLAEKRILELWGEIDEDQKAAIHQMVEESKASPLPAEQVFEEHENEVIELYQDLMDDEAADEEEPEG